MCANLALKNLIIWKVLDSKVLALYTQKCEVQLFFFFYFKEFNFQRTCTQRKSTNTLHGYSTKVKWKINVRVESLGAIRTKIFIAKLVLMGLSDERIKMQILIASLHVPNTVLATLMCICCDHYTNPVKQVTITQRRLSEEKFGQRHIENQF